MVLNNVYRLCDHSCEHGGGENSRGSRLSKSNSFPLLSILLLQALLVGVVVEIIRQIPLHLYLYEALDGAIVCKAYVASLWCFAEARHTHNVACQSDDKTTACVKFYVFDVYLKILD